VPLNLQAFNAWRLKARALTLLVLQRREAAEAVFGQMLARAPGDAYALASRSHVRAQLGRLEAAIEDAQALVQTHPQRSAGDWFNLGFLLEQAHRVSEAEAAFRRALALDDKLDRAWYGLGLALIRQHRFDDAVAALKRNTELQPMSPYGWYQLARVHMDRDDPQAARHIIRHLQGFEPKVAAQLQRETGLSL
jgi:tetratricopeptide (TPR) repeat protein